MIIGNGTLKKLKFSVYKYDCPSNPKEAAYHVVAPGSAITIPSDDTYIVTEED